MSGDHMDHSNSPNAADWQFGNPSMSIALPNSSNPMYQGIQSVPMAENFNPKPWSNPMNLQNSGFATNTIHIGKPVPLPPRLDMGMFLPDNPGMLPPSLSDFPADSSFIERAAKFSSFSAGNFTALVSPFGTPMPVDHGSRCESPINIQRDNASGRDETADMANLSGDSSSKGLNEKKRKKSSQNMELDQVQEDLKFSGDVPRENVEAKKNIECSSSTLPAGKSNGKNVKGATDETKLDYIHVRARRGQATNSHSLAERVRRERISERMKYLQDLVPGCSKVTGKAVMLDEIINYVQSLQRQVEFLSMKLATVNPNIDLNVEGLLSKDILQCRTGSSLGGFLPDLIHSQLVQCQQGLVQTGILSMVNHPDVLRAVINPQFTAMNGFKEPAPQITIYNTSSLTRFFLGHVKKSPAEMPNPWETELQNMVQMNFGTNASPNNQEFNGKPNGSCPL